MKKGVLKGLIRRMLTESDEGQQICEQNPDGLGIQAVYGGQKFGSQA
jgi:hypothetical protein